MVLTALENTQAKPQKEITPFQHWFNKNQNNLEEEYMKEFIDLNEEHKEGFINWCKDKYNEKN